MSRKAIPPEIPIAQRKNHLTNSVVFSVGIQPSAVSIPWPAKPAQPTRGGGVAACTTPGLKRGADIIKIANSSIFFTV